MGSLHFLRAPPISPSPDTACFEVFARELDYLYWSLQRLGARPVDIEDLLQDIFAILHKSWPNLDTTRPMRPWLLAVAFRVVQTYRRRRARETPIDGLDPADEVPDPEAALHSQQSVELLRAALQSVPDTRRTVLTLHELEGLEVSVIARRLGLTRFGVYSRLRKGRKELATAVRRLHRERLMR